MSRTRLVSLTDSTQRKQAMDWLMRLSDDDVDESVVAEWSRWYQAQKGNKAAFDTLQEFSEQCDGLLDDRSRAARIQAMATAPSWHPMRGLIARVDEWVRAHSPTPSFFSLGALSAACLIAVAITLPRGYGERSADATVQDPIAQTLNVRETLLPDGSKIELAPKSSIEVAYSDDQRLLQLSSGEGYFSVAPNKNRPFVVKVGDLNVRAVGTEFNIRRTEGRVVVTVTKGTVDVYVGPGDQPASAFASGPVPGGVRVSEGNEVTWTGRVPMVASIDAKHAATWRQGRLEYIQEPLVSVVADINRYSAREIVIRDKNVGQLTFTGTVLTDNTEEWLHSLPGVFPVTISSDGSHEYLDVDRAEASRPLVR